MTEYCTPNKRPNHLRSVHESTLTHVQCTIPRLLLWDRSVLTISDCIKAPADTLNMSAFWSRLRGWEVILTPRCTVYKSARWLCLKNTWRTSQWCVWPSSATKYIVRGVYWCNESGSPWRSIDWIGEQYNKVGTVWQKAKWQRHIEPHSIEAILAIIIESDKGIFRAEWKKTTCTVHWCNYCR